MSRHPLAYDLRSLCADWLFLNEHLNNPMLVHDRCAEESERFREFLVQREAYRSARLVYGLKFGEFMGKPVITAAHIAVQIDNLVVDWTARQFDPEAPVPRVATIEEFHAEWAPIPDRRTT